MKNENAGPNDVALAEQRVENRRALARAQWVDVTTNTQRALDNTQRLVTHPLVLAALVAAGVLAGVATGKSQHSSRPAAKVATSGRRAARRQLDDLRETLRQKKGGLIASMIASAAPFLMRQAMSAAQDMLLKPRNRGGGKSPDSNKDAWRGAGTDGSGAYRQSKVRGAEGPRL
jgi:hypothetical protein